METLLGAILLALDFIFSIFLFFAGGYAFYGILNKLWGKKEQILIIPPFLTFRFASFFVFQNIIFIIMCRYLLLFNANEINDKNIQVLIYILIVTLIIGLIMSLCSYTQFYKDRIYRRSVSHMFKLQKYSYGEISEVRVNTFRGARGIIFLRYYVIFNNKTKINLNTMELHKGGFGTKKVTKFNDIMNIEKNISERVPHFISEDAVYELEKYYVYLKSDTHKKFRI
ncbi:hypothetical protein [Candidatus Clostridium radicumherbarum]|uniref:DUF304 domain-containing protein n=1 Tax=Candidatus Clostridium radicumherbarum TaxID=3381662 RepID=A0ABW8TVJ4_9CLOT